MRVRKRAGQECDGRLRLTRMKRVQRCEAWRMGLRCVAVGAGQPVKVWRLLQVGFESSCREPWKIYNNDADGEREEKRR